MRVNSIKAFIDKKIKLAFVIAELQIEPNQNHLLKNLEGSMFAWLFGRVFGCSSVTVTTVLMLLWPLKTLKLSKL